MPRADSRRWSAAERAAVHAFEDEVIDRLYVLNAERAAEEERLGLSKGKGKKATLLEGPRVIRSRGDGTMDALHRPGLLLRTLTPMS